MPAPFSKSLRCALLFACMIGPGLVAGIDPRDAAMVAILPFLMLLIPFSMANLSAWRHPGRIGGGLARAGWIIYGAWSVGWAGGYACLVMLRLRYHLGPLDVPVIEALSQTSTGETLEYVSEAGLAGVAAAIFASVIAGLALTFAMRLLFPGPPRAERRKSVIALLAAVQMSAVWLLHGNVLVERANPFSLAHVLYTEARALREETASLRATRAGVHAQLASWAPRYEGPPRATFVLVIGESSNRWDWSLYGYSRRTNPELEALRKELLVFTDVVSSFGSTMNELTRMLTVADHEGAHDWRRQPTVLNLAAGAGYRTFWLTNQSFPFANALFAAEADVRASVYKGRFGRHDASSDEKLLPELDAALADQSPRKFIVVHMLGSHPDYERRYPAERDVFGHSPDAVDADMQDRWFWVRQKRAAYDNSILETDHVLAAMIRRLQRQRDGSASLLFVSDHAQDVGHLTGSWGHQFHLESGFTVPLLVWKKGEPPERALEARPFQTDRLEWTLLDLLHVATAHDDESSNLLSPDFQPWQRRLDGIDYVPGVSHRPEGHPQVSGR